MRRGSNAENEAAELAWIFGGNEPDIEPPTVEIVEPTDRASFPAGTRLQLRAEIGDNYGGFGWRFIVEKDGVVEYDSPDDKDVDAEYRAALNLVNLEPGEFTMSVEVMDHYNEPRIDTVMFYVEGGVDDTGGSASADENGGSSDGDASASASGNTGNDADADDSDGGNDSISGIGGGASGEDGGVNPRGCACSSSGPPASALVPMLVVLAGVQRRRAPRRGGSERPNSASGPAETAPAVLA